MKIVTIRNEKMTVQISTRGAELQSIRDQKGEEYLWHGDAAYWPGRAPIMFPVCGGLKDDRYCLNGTVYEMPKHGYVRQLIWEVEKEEASSATFLMKEKHPGFPFCYELRATYTLVDASIKVHYQVSNQDEREFVFGIGSHEGYAIPAGLENCSIAFETPERVANCVLQGNLILREPVVMAEETRELPLKTEYFAVDALVFPNLKSRSVTLMQQGKARVRVDYQGMDVLMLWTKPGAGYLCIEPWTNAPDYVDADGDIRHKPGMIALAPGETVEKEHTITFL